MLSRSIPEQCRHAVWGVTCATCVGVSQYLCVRLLRAVLDVYWWGGSNGSAPGDDRGSALGGRRLFR